MLLTVLFQFFHEQVIGTAAVIHDVFQIKVAVAFVEAHVLRRNVAARKSARLQVAVRAVDQSDAAPLTTILLGHKDARDPGIDLRQRVVIRLQSGSHADDLSVLHGGEHGLPVRKVPRADLFRDMVSHLDPGAGFDEPQEFRSQRSAGS